MRGLGEIILGKELNNMEPHSEKDTHVVFSVLLNESWRTFQSVGSNDSKRSLKLVHLPFQQRETLRIGAFTE